MIERRNSSGFTLIEVLAVLAITTLILSLALPMFGSTLTPAKLDAAAYRVATLFENERYAARRSGQPAIIEIRREARALNAKRTNITLNLPAQITLSTDALSPCAQGDAVVIFYQDGRACAPLIHLTGSSLAVDIEISAVTGAISIVH